MAAADIGGWVTDSATVVNDIMSSYYQVEAASNSEKRAMAFAERQRRDELAQRATENKFKQMALDLDESKYGFEKMKWGKSWKMTKQQYQDQRNDAMLQMQRTGRLDALSRYDTTIQQGQQGQNRVIGLMGA